MRRCRFPGIFRIIQVFPGKQLKHQRTTLHALPEHSHFQNAWCAATSRCRIAGGPAAAHYGETGMRGGGGRH
jgi:hypothetical protein